MDQLKDLSCWSLFVKNIPAVNKYLSVPNGCLLILGPPDRPNINSFMSIGLRLLLFWRF